MARAREACARPERLGARTREAGSAQCASGECGGQRWLLPRRSAAPLHSGPGGPTWPQSCRRPGPGGSPSQRPWSGWVRGHHRQAPPAQTAAGRTPRRGRGADDDDAGCGGPQRHRVRGPAGRAGRRSATKTAAGVTPTPWPICRRQLYITIYPSSSTLVVVFCPPCPSVPHSGTPSRQRQSALQETGRKAVSRSSASQT